MDGHLLHWYPRWHQCLCGKGLLHHYSMGLRQVLLEMHLPELRVQCPKEEERRELKRTSIEMLHVNNWQRIACDFWGKWIVHQCTTYLTLRSFKGTLASFRFQNVCIVRTSQQSTSTTQKEQDGIVLIGIVSVGWRNEDFKRHFGLVAIWIMRYAMVAPLLKVLQQQQRWRYFLSISFLFWNKNPSCFGDQFQLNRSLLLNRGECDGILAIEADHALGSVYKCTVVWLDEHLWVSVALITTLTTRVVMRNLMWQQLRVWVCHPTKHQTWHQDCHTEYLKLLVFRNGIAHPSMNGNQFPNHLVQWYIGPVEDILN